MSITWRADAPANLIKLAVGRCLIAEMDHGKWLELGLLTDTAAQIDAHPRLLRSLLWNDDDYDKCVLQMTPVVLGEDPSGMRPDDLPNLNIVADFLDLPAWLAVSDPSLFGRLYDADDSSAMPDGTVLTEVEAAAQRLQVGEMRRQIERIRRDHADDPEALVGQAKDLVESTCKTILGLTGTGEETKENVPSLVKKTLIHLGLDPASVAATGGDTAESQALKRILGGVSSILTGADELRNARGTGHGRSGTPLVDEHLARLAVGLVLPAVVFLCETWEKRADKSATPAPGVDTRPTAAAPPIALVAGDVVRHATFGEGIVFEVEESATAAGPVVRIDFGGGIGAKRLLVKYAHLTVVRRAIDNL